MNNYSHVIFHNGESGKEEQLIFKQKIYKDEKVEYNLVHGDFVRDEYRE